MQADFWQERWREGRIGFHQAEVTPPLAKYWRVLGLRRDSRVFVPLCGKSLDMVWLAEQGHHILGVELAQTAVEQFFDERGLTPTISASDYGTHYTAGPFELICGDAFALNADVLADCAAVYDRAALIALPHDLRQRYAATVYASLPIDCRGLLITLEYPQQQKDGPPFSVAETEVFDLFGGRWHPRLMERENILQREVSFQNEGVTELHTCVYALEPPELKI